MKNKKIKILDFKIEAKSAIPVYEQIKQAIKYFIISNILAEGDQLMSIRELGARLKIHPNTISKVYYQLEMESFIYSKPGAGYFVSLNKTKIEKEKSVLFERVTKEYINKAIKMGFSPDEMITELKKTLNSTYPGIEKGVNDD